MYFNIILSSMPRSNEWPLPIVPLQNPVFNSNFCHCSPCPSHMILFLQFYNPNNFLSAVQVMKHLNLKILAGIVRRHKSDLISSALCSRITLINVPFYCIVLKEKTLEMWKCIQFQVPIFYITLLQQNF